jgi:hypothetical protein
MPLEPLPFNCRGATSDNGKARSFRDGGPDLDAVTKQFKGSPNYEEPEAETFAPSFVQPFKCLKHPRKVFWCNANSRVVDVYSNLTTETAAPDENAPSRIGVLNGVGQQIAQDTL